MHHSCCWGAVLVPPFQCIAMPWAYLATTHLIKENGCLTEARSHRNAGSLCGLDDFVLSGPDSGSKLLLLWARTVVCCSLCPCEWDPVNAQRQLPAAFHKRVLCGSLGDGGVLIH